MMSDFSLNILSPFGPYTITGTESAITRLKFAREAVLSSEEEREAAPAVLRQCAQELAEYFAGERKTFTVPLAPEGTEFQQRDWAELQRIPFGETRSYGEIAVALGNPAASRAVGLANNRNPISILIPCHRVIGANGSLTGYAAGCDVKRALLNLEAEATAPLLNLEAA